MESGNLFRNRLTRLVQRKKSRPERVGRTLGLAALEFADGRLRDSAVLSNKRLGPPPGLEFFENVHPIHRSASRHRNADIVANGLPIVNVGRLSGMEKGSRSRTPFGLRMSAARKAAKLTQEQVCAALKISQGTLSGLEKAAQGSSHTVRFAALYGVNATWLATGNGEMKAHAAKAGASPPPNPPDQFKDRRLVTPSQWALLHAIEDLMPEKEKEDYLLRWERTRQRALQEIRERSGARGMSELGELDEAPKEETNRRAKK